MIRLHGVLIENKEYGVIIIKDKEIKEPYKVVVYTSNSEMYDFYEHPSELGYKTIMIPLKEDTKYTIAIHKKYGELESVKFYDIEELNITGYNALEEEEEEEKEIKLEIKKINQK